MECRGWNVPTKRAGVSDAGISPGWSASWGGIDGIIEYYRVALPGLVGVCPTQAMRHELDVDVYSIIPRQHKTLASGLVLFAWPPRLNDE